MGLVRELWKLRLLHVGRCREIYYLRGGKPTYRLRLLRLLLLLLLLLLLFRRQRRRRRRQLHRK